MSKKYTFTINDYKWTLMFVDVAELPEKTDGTTLYNERTILIRNDLNRITTGIVIRHELTHAILCTQGRWSQNNFNQEDVCEFVGFQLPTINRITKGILGTLGDE